MMGIAGLAVTPIPAGGTGRVSARGELWTARCAEAVAAGEAVVVSGLDGLVLTVRRTPAREGPTP
jgi:membrane protein implicated in regulation of membrane protease activity